MAARAALRGKLGLLLEQKGRLFSEELAIDVARQPFRWLLASILFGRRISGAIAKRTYSAFARRHLLTPAAILRVGRDGLIPVMGEGGYARYDNMTSGFITAVCTKLVDEYGGKVETIHARARDSADLEARLRAFMGVGPVTCSIFLRELRGVWAKADPPLTDIEMLAAKTLGLTRAEDPKQILRDLKALWNRERLPGFDFRHLVAALVRTGIELRARHGSRPEKRRPGMGCVR